MEYKKNSRLPNIKDINKDFFMKFKKVREL